MRTQARARARKARCAWLLAGWLGLGAASAGPPARAELYRCARSGGGVTFTNDPSACPGADPAPAEDRIQRVPGGDSAAAAGAGPPARAARIARDPGGEAAEAAVWRGRKRQAEAELRAVRGEREALEQYLTHCNHGRQLFTRNQNGIKSSVSCSGLREQHAALGKRERELAHFLTEELEEECRRSGCLPGWLR